LIGKEVGEMVEEIIGDDEEEEEEMPELPAEVEKDPQIKKINDLLRSLLMHCSNIVFDVAVCDCPNGNGCGVLRDARNIARVMNELRNMQDVVLKHSAQQLTAESKEVSESKKKSRKKKGGA